MLEAEKGGGGIVSSPPPKRKIYVHPEPQNVTLFRNRVFVDVVSSVKMKSCWIIVGPKSLREGQAETERHRRPCKDREQKTNKKYLQPPEAR